LYAGFGIEAGFWRGHSHTKEAGAEYELEIKGLGHKSLNDGYTCIAQHV